MFGDGMGARNSYMEGRPLHGRRREAKLAYGEGC